MVIGNGMIARRFAAYAEDARHIIFASGVSNSGNTDGAVYNREIELLIKAIRHHPDMKLIYFSTCGIYDAALAASPYILHKLKIEATIAELCKAYCIFRVSNPIGFTNNTHTVLNYFVSCIQQGRHFQVWEKAYRNLIDLDDMFCLCDAVLARSVGDRDIVNIANPDNYAVTAIVESIEQHLNKTAFITMINKESNPVIETEHIKPLINEFRIQFGPTYLPALLQRYFPTA